MISWSGGSSRLSGDAALSVGAVYTCTNILSRTVGTLPIKLVYRDPSMQDRKVEHRLNKIISIQPNSWQTSFEFRQLITTHLCLRGNFYAFKNVVRGELREIIPINPDAVTVKQNDDLTLTYTVREKNGNNRDFGQKEILHIRGLSTDGVIGKSVVECLAGSVSAIDAAEKHHNRLLANGAKPSGLLVFPDKLSDEQYKKQVEKITKAAGGNNAGSTLILDCGVEFKPVSLKATDIELIQTLKLNRQQVYGAFGVPPHMAGDLERATFSNIENQDLGYFKHGVAPTLAQIEQCFDRDLLNDEEKEIYTHRFNPDGLLRGDVKSRYEAYTLSIMYGIRNANEIRALENLPPRADGMGDQYYFSAQLLPAGTRPIVDQEVEDEIEEIETEAGVKDGN